MSKCDPSYNAEKNGNVNYKILTRIKEILVKTFLPELCFCVCSAMGKGTNG